jgi:hypothetical protein
MSPPSIPPQGGNMILLPLKGDQEG